jgi:hypothetical protein
LVHSNAECGLRNLRAVPQPFVPIDGGLEEGALQSITSKAGEPISDLVGVLGVHQIRNNLFFK